jgi:hypothetical protein
MSFAIKKIFLNYFLGVSLLIAANKVTLYVLANGLLVPVGTKYAKSKPYF